MRCSRLKIVMWYFRWFLSKTLRRSVESYKQVNKMLHEQRDLLKPAQQEQVAEALGRLRKAIQTPMTSSELLTITEREVHEAGKVLLPYPDSWMRETVEMFLVVLVSVIAFRAFFLQPFKIPTGSMQPTLYGITHVDLLDDDSRPVPDRLGRVGDWFRGVTWYHLKAEGKWKLVDITEPTPVSFTKPWGTQKFIFETIPEGRRVERKIWYSYFDNPPYKTESDPFNGGLVQRALAHMRERFERDSGELNRARFEGMRSVVARNWRDLDNDGLSDELVFEPGEDVFKFCVKTGDHLFVDRMVYNFRKPQRGEIIVFETKGIKYMKDQGTDNQFYIKRLVALDGESLCIGGPDLPLKAIKITNNGDAPKQITGYEHFDDLDQLLGFNRRKAHGYRPDLDSGDAVEITPGATREVMMTPITDQHVRINGRALDSGYKNFEHIYDLEQKISLVQNTDGNSSEGRTYRKFYSNAKGVDFPVFSGRSSKMNPAYIGHTGYPENRVQRFGGDDWNEVPGKGYWAMGDNTSSSSDSRMWGEVPERNLIGTPFFIYWPLLADPERTSGSYLFGWDNWGSALVTILVLLGSVWWLFRLPIPKVSPVPIQG